MVTKLSRELPTEESWMAKKHVRKPSTSLVIREMQIERILRFYLSWIRMPKIKLSTNRTSWWRMLRKGNIPSLLGLFKTCKTTLEINLTVFQKIGNSSTYTAPDHIAKRSATISQRHVLHYIHGSFIHNRKNWKQPSCLSLNWRMDK